MRILVLSVHEAFEYVMDHYAPVGLEEFALRKDTYAVLSIQCTQNGGFGFTFQRNRFCRDVLTLFFDDIERPVEGAQLFSEEQAGKALRFLLENRDRVDTLVIHCYAGESRSRAVAMFAADRLGMDLEDTERSSNFNRHVYKTLQRVYEKTDA